MPCLYRSAGVIQLYRHGLPASADCDELPGSRIDTHICGQARRGNHTQRKNCGYETGKEHFTTLASLSPEEKCLRNTGSFFRTKKPSDIEAEGFQIIKSQR